MNTPGIWYEYLTEAVAAKARTDEMLQELIVAVVHAAADFDMYATGKVDPDNEDHSGSYAYFRNIIDRLGIPTQAILDVIDECLPDDPRANLTKCSAVAEVAVEVVEKSGAAVCGIAG